MRSEEQMRRANAGWVIALVENTQPVRDVARKQAIREPMDGYGAMLDGDLAIAVAVDTTAPLPTAIANSGATQQLVYESVHLNQSLLSRQHHQADHEEAREEGEAATAREILSGESGGGDQGEESGESEEGDGIVERATPA
jgi:hypothetical protein